MTHLNIQQDLNISELVTTKLIQKLYDNALSVPKPSGKNPDNAYMSGKLEVPKAYKSQVLYLAGNINGEPNASGRFADLRIDVTSSYYIEFEDPEVASVLLSTVSTDGIGVTEAEAANATFTTSTFLNNTDITSFNTFNYFTKANNNPPYDLFRGCTNLTSVNTSNITTLIASEFRDSGLTGELSMPNLTGTIPVLCFKSCRNITSITNLGHITGISPEARGGGNFDGAFQECTSLVSVTIPSTVTAISAGFLNCINLTTINGNTENITTLGTCAFHKTKIPSIPNMPNLLQIGDACFSYNTSLTGIINFPYVTTIGSEAFKSCPNITGALNLPSLISLGTSAFYATGITSITDLGSITVVPRECFRNCSSLTNITLPNTVTEIKWGAFLDCTNAHINIPASCTKLELYALFNTAGTYTKQDIENVVITEAGRDGGIWNSGKFLHSGELILNNLQKACCRMFENTSGITSVKLPNCTYVEAYGTFAGCQNLTELYLDSVITLGGDFAYNSYGMCEGCIKLKKVRLNSNITTITPGIFHGCTLLDDINIEDFQENIISIGNFAFYDSDSLTNKVLYFPSLVGKGADGNWSSHYWWNDIKMYGAFSNSANMSIYLPNLLSLPSVGTDYQRPQNLFNVRTNGCIANTVYFKNIGNFPLLSFYGANIKTLIINNTTVPTFTSYNGGQWTDTLIGPVAQTNTDLFFGATIGTLYVPDSAVSAYEADSHFASLANANKIKPLSLCPVVTKAQQENGDLGVIQDYM